MPRKIKTVLGYVVKDAPIQSTEPADTPEKIRPFLDQWKDADREHFIAIYLNARMKVVAVDVISIGTLSASLVHPREVFKGALLFNAAAVVVAHNHPSGDALPSVEDKDVTRRLCKAGELLGVPVVDHVIFTPNGGLFSFRDRGLL